MAAAVAAAEASEQAPAAASAEAQDAPSAEASAQAPALASAVASAQAEAAAAGDCPEAGRLAGAARDAVDSLKVNSIKYRTNR